jgi:hypothetical protein
LLENSPKNCCQFRAVASAQTKQAYLSEIEKRDWAEQRQLTAGVAPE